MLANRNSLFLFIKTVGFFSITVVVVFYFLWSSLPSQDPVAYFDFADKRRFLGLVCFWNVFSNVLFLYVSLFGFVLFIRNYHALDVGLWESFLVLNIAIFLTCWGSSFFHLDPTPQSLIWDRLPMSIGFASLIAFVFSDRITDKYTRFLLPVLVTLFCFLTFATNWGPKDLRFYIVAQFGGILVCALILAFYRKGRLSTRLLVIAFVLYGLAKVCEIFDKTIFDNFFLSGHTLKHIFAAFAVFYIYLAASRVHLKIKKGEEA